MRIYSLILVIGSCQCSSLFRRLFGFGSDPTPSHSEPSIEETKDVKEKKLSNIADTMTASSSSMTPSLLTVIEPILFKEVLVSNSAPASFSSTTNQMTDDVIHEDSESEFVSGKRYSDSLSAEKESLIENQRQSFDDDPLPEATLDLSDDNPEHEFELIQTEREFPPPLEIHQSANFETNSAAITTIASEMEKEKEKEKEKEDQLKDSQHTSQVKEIDSSLESLVINTVVEENAHENPIQGESIPVDHEDTSFHIIDDDKSKEDPETDKIKEEEEWVREENPKEILKEENLIQEPNPKEIVEGKEKEGKEERGPVDYESFDEDFHQDEDSEKSKEKEELEQEEFSDDSEVAIFNLVDKEKDSSPLSVFSQETIQKEIGRKKPFPKTRDQFYENPLFDRRKNQNRIENLRQKFSKEKTSKRLSSPTSNFDSRKKQKEINYLKNSSEDQSNSLFDASSKMKIKTRQSFSSQKHNKKRKNKITQSRIAKEEHLPKHLKTRTKRENRHGKNQGIFPAESE